MKPKKLTILPAPKQELYNGYKVRIQLIRESGDNYKNPYKINNSLDVFNLVKDELSVLDREIIAVLLLDNQNQINGIHEIALGTINCCTTTPADP